MLKEIKPEWTIDQIREFVKKDYPSVSARMVKCLLAYFDESKGEETEINWDELRKKYFDECTVYRDRAGTREIATAPHVLFDWFKNNLVSGDAVEKEPRHPEDFCQLCGNPNPIWYADNKLFNKVNGAPNGIICPCCFEKKAKELGISLIFKANLVEGDAVEKEQELLQWVDEKLLEVKADMSQGWRGEDLNLLIQRRTDLDFFKKKILSVEKQPNEE